MEQALSKIERISAWLKSLQDELTAGAQIREVQLEVLESLNACCQQAVQREQGVAEQGVADQQIL